MPKTSQAISDINELLAMFSEDKSGHLRQPLNAAHAVEGCADYVMTYAKVVPRVLDNATTLAICMEYAGEKDGAERCYGVIREACLLAVNKHRSTDEAIQEAGLPARPLNN